VTDDLTVSDPKHATPRLDWIDGRHAVVLGGAGFLGSHLTSRLLALGARVTVIDNFVTGPRANADRLAAMPGCQVIEANVSHYIGVPGEVDAVLHFASPASPRDYLRWPIETLKVGALGTHNALGLARAKGARFLLASTSEVYGDPLVNPQPETYWGNVNPIGPRGVYDEAKRFAEALTLAYARTHGIHTRIARIFNTYGPGMRVADGGAVPAFFVAALRNEPVVVHGTGQQTRSLCYVDDLIDGVLRLLVSDVDVPVNLGNPDEISILRLAEMIRDVVGSDSPIEFGDQMEDDPQVRCPDITRAEELLDWSRPPPSTTGWDCTAAVVPSKQANRH
jgi:dTDP-glucose 4,6-dehydratase